MITHKRTNHLLCPIRATWEEIKRHNDRMLKERSNVSRSVFFYLFLSSKEVQMSPQFELFTSLLRLLFADGWRGQSHHQTPHGEGTLCELCVGTRVSGHKGPWDRKSVGFFPHHNKTIKNLIRRGRGATSFTSVCFVCRAMVNTSSACSFQIWPPCSSRPLHRTVCALSYKRTVAPAASAKLEKKDTVAWTQNQQCCTDKYI